MQFFHCPFFCVCVCVLSPVTEICRLFFFLLLLPRSYLLFLAELLLPRSFFFLEVKIRSTERQLSKGKRVCEDFSPNLLLYISGEVRICESSNGSLCKDTFSLFLFILFLFTTRRDDSLLIVFSLSTCFFFLLPFLPAFFLLRFYLLYLRTSDIPFLNCAATLAVQSEREKETEGTRYLGLFPFFFL